MLIHRPGLPSACRRLTVGWFVVLHPREKDAYDYRFMPEPDVPPVRVTQSEVEALRLSLPEMPAAVRKRLESPTADGG